MADDRLAEIKAREFGPTRGDADWLVTEVERLRKCIAGVARFWNVEADLRPEDEELR